MAFDEDTEEEWLDDEAEDSDDLLVCPSCRTAVHEDTQQCPYCGDWIVPAHAAVRWKHWAWIIAVVLVVLSFLLSAAL
jgi:RNA polymerase subunit RPABC4/transcription elongation factor Spt4